MQNSSQLSEPLQHLRSVAEQADHVINTLVYRQARRLFTACVSDPQHLTNLQQLASEYGTREYLLCVDSTGSPAPVPQGIVKDFRKTTSDHPDFALWFHETMAEGSEGPALLVARWLCHLVGFRHRSVHLFIDHPAWDDYTLIQVRGMSKAESPGCFDVPAAGHVTGLESTTDTLLQELAEELDLGPDDVGDLEMIGTYNYREPLTNSALRNVEFRTVFRGRLKADSLLKIRFADREVAAISMFALPELKGLIEAFLQRVASGLAESFPVYLSSKNRRGT